MSKKILPRDWKTTKAIEDAKKPRGIGLSHAAARPQRLALDRRKNKTKIKITLAGKSAKP